MGQSEPSFIFWMSGLVIAASLVFGGGSHVGFPGDVVVQLLAIPLLVLALRGWSVRMTAMSIRSVDFLLYAAMFVFAVLLIVQLVPWPAALRPAAENGTGHLFPSISDPFAVRGWYGFSVAPAASWAAATSLIPCLALFCGVRQLDADSRFKLTSIVIGLGAFALLIGFVQVLQGPESDWRFFEISNPSEAVGFFANRNHFAAQLYATLVFAAVWFGFSTDALFTARKANSRSILRFVIFALLVVAVLAAITVARSRAGILLSIAAVIAIAFMFAASRRRADRRNNRSHMIQRLVWAGFAFAVLFAGQFGIHRVVTSFEADALEDLRVTLSPATLDLALASMPFGTGLGTFTTVYANNEKVQHLFNGYANRAHNDWAEFLLEAGIFGVVIGGLFLVWFARRTIQIWGQDSAQEVHHHLMLQRGASLVIGLLLAHSLVDYPLRTTAMSAIFTFSCALLMKPKKHKIFKPNASKNIR